MIALKHEFGRNVFLPARKFRLSPEFRILFDHAGNTSPLFGDADFNSHRHCRKFFCVLFTANDAYMRDFNLVVPSDCTVSNTKHENQSALTIMRKFVKEQNAAAHKLFRRRIVRNVFPKKAWRRNRPLEKMPINLKLNRKGITPCCGQ